MKVALVQMDIVWENSKANRDVAERLMLAAEKCDIYVLPEMWSTGVTTEPMGVAEPEDGETLQWMQRMADKLDAAVVGSIAVKAQDGTFRNRLYFVKPCSTSSASEALPQRGSGEGATWYDKHHLFSYGGETEHYTPGEERVTVEWRGVRFRLSICYDLRFPLWLRNRDDYDVLICVASWPSVRMHAWNVLLAARAIENQSFVLGVNRIGRDPYCEYSGGTCVVDPFGFSTACPEGEACVLTQTLDLRRQKSFREKFPVLREMDTP
ncbi:MAG: nitrilase family protein [Bacteroidaceae bacterium]|nr:nitrilase family protein [Bacteroidaceae bacterium]